MSVLIWGAILDNILQVTLLFDFVEQKQTKKVKKGKYCKNRLSVNLYRHVPKFSHDTRTATVFRARRCNSKMLILLLNFVWINASCSQWHYKWLHFFNNYFICSYIEILFSFQIQSSCALKTYATPRSANNQPVKQKLRVTEIKELHPLFWKQHCKFHCCRFLWLEAGAEGEQ